MNAGDKPVLILGAGINGCALARELLLGGVSVYVVDMADVASGATSGSSRLIHGGLRYLEFGEFDLVKESLAERTRLLRLAPQFVRPLRLSIPAASRFGGLLGSVGRFFGWRWWPDRVPSSGRGVWLIRAGLALYDLYARDPLLPEHKTVRTALVDMPPVDRKKYRWLCSYFDAQVTFPERLVLAMLEDARLIAAQRGLDFRLWNYHLARLTGDTVEISPLPDNASGTAPCQVQPAVIVNATGAWVDETLARLHVPSERLMGGTKGSHLFTSSPRLRSALQTGGVYAEASDGRPIFITPLAEVVLIGTTDEPFDGPPENALATQAELDYLLTTVNTIFREVHLTRDDIDFHYSAVRPLPYVTATTPAAITRRHALAQNDNASVPLLSVVGGKLTTMRSLAEAATAAILAQMGRAAAANSQARIIPGGDDYPADLDALHARWQQIAERVALPVSSVAAVWQLVGTRTEVILGESTDRELLPDTDLPCAMARWSIRHEWACTLADLVERRLMLLYHQRLTRDCLRRLAELLSEEGRLMAPRIDVAVQAEIGRLQARYGKRVV